MRSLPLILALLIACEPAKMRPTGPSASPGGADGEDPPSAEEEGEGDSADEDDTSEEEDDEAPPVTADPLTVLGHAQECSQGLGPVPGFDCMEETVELPITVNEVVPGEGEWSDYLSCDRPVVLTGRCTPGARIGHKHGQTWSGEVDTDVDWVFTCRPRDVDGGLAGIFHDVAMIGHRASTGETCFFQSFPDAPVDRAPSPMEDPADAPEGQPTADAFWIDPAETAEIRCVRCHDNDPWVHSPYVDQARRPDAPEQTVVPPARGLEHPYIVLGTAFADWPHPMMQIRPADNGCVSCHRMGTGNSCADFARYATGGDTSYPLSIYARSWPQSHWMPPGHAGSEADWEESWLDDVQQILRCCEDPERSECGLQPIPDGPG